MKLIDYLDKLNKFRGNQQAITFQNEPVNLKTELYYTLSINLPNKKVDSVIHNKHLSSIKVRATLNELKDLLNKLDIFLIIDNEEESLTLFQKFEGKRKVKIDLLSTMDYIRLFSFELQEKELGNDLKELKNKFSYVAFFSDKELNSSEKQNISIMLTSKLINSTIKGVEGKKVNDKSKLELFKALKKQTKNKFDLDVDDFTNKPLTDKEIIDRINK
jgi:hypothetical protein